EIGGAGGTKSHVARDQRHTRLDTPNDAAFLIDGDEGSDRSAGRSNGSRQLLYVFDGPEIRGIEDDATDTPNGHHPFELSAWRDPHEADDHQLSDPLLAGHAIDLLVDRHAMRRSGTGLRQRRT